MKAKKAKIIICVVVLLVICIVPLANALFGNHVQSATPLTENQVKELFITSHNLYSNWLGSAKNVNGDWNKTITINGIEYFEVTSTDITTVDELKDKFAECFDKSIYDKKIDELYIMYNGKIYGNCILSEGGDISWQKHKLAMDESSDTKYVVTVTSQFEDDERKLNYTLKVIDGKWKFTDQFNCLTTEDLVLE